MLNNYTHTEEGKQGAFSVCEAMNLAKQSLETLVLKVVGEVSELNIKRGYSAVYFTVKDDNAVMPCMMWFNRYKAQECELELGQLVELTGRFSLYPKNGRMSFDVFSLSLAGEGNLRLKVANLAKALANEGLMSDERKLPLPRYPETIGLVTSPRGAVVHDVLRTLRRRFPLTKVYLAGVPVEGKQAATNIINGMREVYKQHVDVILVVRGGGSFEDLMPFNDEALARAIAACPIPVVTGIGHEPDTTIADMVADRRASTPTAAAEAISPDKTVLQSYFDTQKQSLVKSLNTSILSQKMKCERWLQHPLFTDSMQLFSQKALDMDALSLRLHGSIPQNIRKDEAAVAHLDARLQASLKAFPVRQAQSGERLSIKLKGLSQTLLSPYRTRFEVLGTHLHTLSPLATLQRGYSIVKTEEGIASSINHVKPNDSVSLVFADGVAHAHIDRIDTTSPEQLSW